MGCSTCYTSMTNSTISYFKCTKCGEINTVSDFNKVEEEEKLWSMRSTPSAKRKFDIFASTIGLKAGEALSYLLTLYETKENFNQDNRFGTPNTTTK